MTLIISLFFVTFFSSTGNKSAQDNCTKVPIEEKQLLSRLVLIFQRKEKLFVRNWKFIVFISLVFTFPVFN